MGKLTISMAIFNSYVKLPEGILWENSAWTWKSSASPWEMMKDDDTDERDLHIKMLFLHVFALHLFVGLPGGKQTCQPLQLRMCVQKLGMP